jgi:methionine-rich copper-binding protein CopC
MIPHRLRRSLTALAGASLLLILLPVAVVAHAELDTISPADKSSGPPPQQIVGTFIQNLDPAKSNFRVVNPANGVVAEGGEVDSNNPRRMTLSLSPLAPGVYTIRWTTVSTEDGELDRGETTFTVVAASASPSATPVPSASAALSASPSAAPASALPSLAPSPSPSGGSGTTTSSTDALIPIVAVLVILALLGLWLRRGRGRRAA